jgi:hypothetical protein
VVGDQRLWCAPVANITDAAGRLEVRLTPEVVGELDLHARLISRFVNCEADCPGRRPPGAGEQLVDHLVRDKISDLPG